jgi:hypothetical protein
MMRAERNFVEQQGFPPPASEACPLQFSSLLFQPRIVAVFVLAGLVTQWAPLFLCLGALLAWSAALPAWNPFDALYNTAIGGRGGKPRLTPAPPPRRFAQGMAATFMFTIGGSLLLGWALVAGIAEALLAIALGALVFGKLCLGSYVYHALHGKLAFANRTLPWAREP